MSLRSLALALAVVSVSGCSSSAPAGSGAPDAGGVVPLRLDASVRDGRADTGAQLDTGTPRDVTVEGAALPDTGSVVDASPYDVHEDFDVLVYGDVITIGPGDASVVLPDAAPDAPKLDACGICDRSWTCNGITDTWVSTGPEACADVRHGDAVITVYCEDGDTIGFPSATDNEGTWMQTSTGLTLDFTTFPGQPDMVFTCVPAM